MTADAIAVALGAGWGLLVLWMASRPRPGGVLHRLDCGEPVAAAVAGAGAGAGEDRRVGALHRLATATPGRLGGALAAVIGLRVGASVERALGRAVLGGVALVWLSPTMALAGGLLAGALPHLLARRRERQRRAAADRAVPELCELVLVALRAGVSPRTALELGAAWPPPPLAGALARTRRGLQLGGRVDDELAALAAESPAAARFCRSISGAVASGASVASALSQLAAEGRRERRHQAQASARRLPITLLFPLTFCILPAFGLLTVGPAIAVGLRSLQP